MKALLKMRAASTVSALLLLAAFAVGILCTLLYGASAYRQLTDRDEDAFQSRTAAQYLTNRVRQASEAQVAEFGGASALVFPQSIEGEHYLTRIYCHDGWLMELFSDAEGEFSPEDGEKILPVSALSFEKRQGLIIARLKDAAGNERQILLSLWGEEAPL